MRTYDEARGVVMMTMDEWKRTHRDSKGTMLDPATGKKVRTVLQNGGARGTILVSVEIVKESK